MKMVISFGKVITSCLTNFADNITISLLNKTILTLQLDIDDEEPSSQMFNIEADSINKFNFGLDKLLALSVGVDKLIRYVELKLLNIKDEIDEYNEDEEDKDVLVEVLPYYKSFLIGHLIKFFFKK